MTKGEASPRRILVTGGNAGIGLALCRQLVEGDECHVFLGSRSPERGRTALAALRESLPAARRDSVELVELDVSNDGSVAEAAASVRASIGEGHRLYGLVNNAGTGLAHGSTPEVVVNTNLLGVKRMCDAFVATGLVSDRVVNVGSGSGPNYVAGCPPEAQAALCETPASWEAIEAHLRPSADGRTGLGSAADRNGGYGLSKAMVSLYTMLCAREHPEVLTSCVSPGWIATAMTAGSRATKKPEEGTVSIRHALFAELDGNGWYYGSDAVRSPLHFMRNPGEPAYAPE